MSGCAVVHGDSPSLETLVAASPPLTTLGAQRLRRQGTGQDWWTAQGSLGEDPERRRGRRAGDQVPTPTVVSRAVPQRPPAPARPHLRRRVHGAEPLVGDEPAR